MASQKTFNCEAYRSRPWQFFLLLCLLVVSQTASAASVTRIAVLYPESESRVGQVYAKIIDGMSRKNIELHRHAFVLEEPVMEIQQWLNDTPCDAIILLGRQGLRLSEQLRVDIPVITGAHVGVLSDRSAVTLAAEPQQLFHLLMQMKPDVRRVSVIFNQKNSGWLVDLARKAANDAGVQLAAIESHSMRESGVALKKIITQADIGRDAVWLVLDPIVPIKALLPELLKMAWKKRLVVFSGNPYHVQQGTLFALYPDYTGMGQQLIDLALLDIKKDSPVRHQTSRSLNSAVNIRTATHLGAQVKNLDVSLFSLIFPARQ